MFQYLQSLLSLRDPALPRSVARGAASLSLHQPHCTPTDEWCFPRWQYRGSIVLVELVYSILPKKFLSALTDSAHRLSVRTQVLPLALSLNMLVVNTHKLVQASFVGDGVEAAIVKAPNPGGCDVKGERRRVLKVLGTHTCPGPDQTISNATRAHRHTVTRACTHRKERKGLVRADSQTYHASAQTHACAN